MLYLLLDEQDPAQPLYLYSSTEDPSGKQYPAMRLYRMSPQRRGPHPLHGVPKRFGGLADGGQR